MDSFDILTLASEFPEPFSWNFDGQCRVEHAGKAWERSISASWHDSGVGILEDSDRAIWEIAIGGRYGDRAPSIAAAASDGSWSAPHVSPYTHSVITGKTELHWLQMWHRVSDTPTIATVLFLADPPPIIYPHHLPVVPGCYGRTTGENGLRTQLFGRDALVRPKTIDGINYLAIAYEGEEFDENCVTAILTVLSFTWGHDLDVRAQVSVNAEGGATARRLWLPTKVCEQQPRPALNSIENASVAALGANLETMTERARSLRHVHGVPIDVAVKYLLRWNGWQLDLEIRDVTSALNVLIESPLFTPNEGRVVESKDFAAVVKVMKAAIDALPDAVPQALRKRLIERTAEANHTSLNERRRQFWGAVGFEPSPEEILALGRRHTMAHKGFIDTEDAAAEWELFQDISRARTVVNEGILRLLGYNGPVIDYVSGIRPMRAANDAP